MSLLEPQSKPQSSTAGHAGPPRRINGRFAKGYSGNPAGHPTVNEIDRRKRVDAAGSGRQYTPGQNGDGMDVDWNDDKQATAAYRAEKKSKIVSEQHNAGQLQADAPRWSS